MTLAYHDWNGDNHSSEVNDLGRYWDMSISELNQAIDSEILADTVVEVMAIPARLRNAAIVEFEDINPALGYKLRLEVSLLSL